MPIFHCKECHHEWEGKRTICDWCGASSIVLKEKSELEEMLADKKFWSQFHPKHRRRKNDQPK